MRLTVAVVPAGQWGTALAVPLSRGGHSVRLWFRTREEADHFNAHRENHRRLPGIVFPAPVSGTSDLAEAVADADLVILAPASAGLRDLCRRLRSLVSPRAVVVSAVKALFPDEPRFVSQVIAHELDGTGSPAATKQAASGVTRSAVAVAGRIAVLSGPNFAVEVARELPAGTVVASENQDSARFVQAALMTERFRVWTSTDVVGVQLGGALKNIIAIGAGLSDGLGLGDNARAALITRGVAEISRLGKALGANPLTFAGVSGIGDLMLTCTGDLSRNRRAGLAIARGEALDPGTTVEGIPTTKATYHLARDLGVDMPITEVVYRVLYEDLPPEEGMHCLMTRQPTSEHDAIGE